MDRSKWEYKPFEECIEKSKKTKQLMTSDYQPDGAYPIISQEASLISGYTNNPDYVNHFDCPVVIFGDHTRVLKYVDFDFAVGADGVKILIPHANLDAKFLLSFLTWYKIPNLGYSRHYKLLKDISVPVPPIADQQRIVAELDCLNEMIALKQEQLKEFDKLAQSIFYDMFGDPAINDKKWDVFKLGELCTKISDGVHAKPTYVDKGMPFISVVNINKGCLTFENCKYVSEEEGVVINKRSKPERGDVLYTKVGATYGIPALVDTDIDFCLYVSVCLIKPKHEIIDSVFLTRLMGLPYIKHQADERIKGIGVPDLHLNQISAFNIPLPPLALQQQFAEKIQAIEAQKELVKQSIAETQHLLDYTMDKYFG